MKSRTTVPILFSETRAMKQFVENGRVQCTSPKELFAVELAAYHFLLSCVHCWNEVHQFHSSLPVVDESFDPVWFGCRLSLRFLGVRPIDLKQEMLCPRAQSVHSTAFVLVTGGGDPHGGLAS